MAPNSGNDVVPGMMPTSRDASAAPPRLKYGTIFLFILPGLALAFMHGPEQQMQGIYAKHAGLTLAALAGATLLTRAFDAVTYPVIGYLSDLTYARTGSRKSWVVGGALLSTLGAWFLYRPPAGVGITYYVIWTGVIYLGWKTAEIPYQAWSFALTRDYKDRARLQTWRTIAQLIGGMLFFMTPAIAVAVGWTKTSELGFAALNVTAYVSVILIPLMAIIAIWKVPEGEATQPAPAEQRRYGVAESVRAVMRNGPMARLTLGLIPVAVLSGMAAGTQFLFIDTFLNLGDSYPTIMLIAAPIALLGVPFWGFLCIRYERHKVMAASLMLGAVSYMGLSFVSPGPGAAPMVMVLYPLCILSLMGIVALLSMIGDVSDYGRLQSGEDLSGVYASIFNFVQVSLRTVSSAAGIALIGWLGFDATATTQSADGAFGIRLISVILPAIGLGLASLIYWTYPLTRARVEEVRLGLLAREAEQAKSQQDQGDSI